MSDFILEYDMLESIAVYSKGLGKYAEEYGESLEYKVIGGIANVTGPSSGYLQNAGDSVRDKVKALKQKSDTFYHYAEQITNLREVAERIDQEVADAIVSQRGYFLDHHEFQRLDDWKVKLLGLLVDIKIRNRLLKSIANLLTGSNIINEFLEDSIRHWYECGRGKQIISPIVFNKIEPLYYIVGFQLKEPGITGLFSKEVYNLLLNDPFSFCDLNGNKNNGKVDLKSNIKQGYKNTKGSSAWSITGNFFSGVWDGVKDSVVGTIAVVSHPVKTLKDLVKLATLSQKDLVEIGAKAGFAYCEKMINGTPEKRAHMAGKLVAEIALLVAGTKGVDKIAKAVKASKAAKAAKVLDNLEEGSSDLNKVNSVIGKADSTLEKTIKDTYKPGKVDTEVGGANEIIEGSGAGVKGGSKTTNILKETETYIDYLNESGEKIRIPKQASSTIEDSITKNLNSSSIGTKTEAEVAKYVKNNTDAVITDYANKAKDSSGQVIGDIDCATKNELIEVKNSVSSVKVKQFGKYIDSSNLNYLNVYNKKVILYIKESIDMTNPINVAKINEIKKMGVTIVNGLDELKGVIH